MRRDDEPRFTAQPDESFRRKREEFLSTLTIDGITRLSDLPQLDPMQLQDQLVLLYQLVPPRTIFATSWDPENELVIQQDALGKERVNSGEFTKAAAWLEALLNVAPTTCGFDFYLMGEFWKVYRLGMNKQQPADAISSVVYSPSSNLGGFFNPQLAQNYEHEYYRKFLRRDLEITRQVERIANDPKVEEQAMRIITDELEAVGFSDPASDGEDDLEEAVSEGDSEPFKLRAKSWTKEEALDYEYNLYKRLAEVLGRPVTKSPQDLLRDFRFSDMIKEMEYMKRHGRRWIYPVHQVYTKGPRLGRQEDKLPIQRITDADLLLARWRQDFIEKYNDEP